MSHRPKPKLPLSIFAPTSQSHSSSASPRSHFSPDTASPHKSLAAALGHGISSSGYPASVIDSHVHLWSSAQSGVSGLVAKSWAAKDFEGGVLDVETGAKEYGELVRGSGAVNVAGEENSAGKAGERPKPTLDGYVYVEVDVAKDESKIADEGGWKEAIQEVEWITSLDSQAGTGSLPLLAVVPWAPIPAGRKAVSSYIAKLQDLPSLSSTKGQHASLDGTPHMSGLSLASRTSIIRGFRYLLKSSPRGTALKPDFIDALKHLGEQRYVFELAIDPNGREKVDLDEVLDVVSAVRADQKEGERTVFVLDHFGDPDLTAPLNAVSESFMTHATQLREFSLTPDVYLKMSGFLSHFQPSILQQAFHEFLLVFYPDIAKSYEPIAKQAEENDTKADVQAGKPKGHTRAQSSIISPYSQVKKAIKLFLEVALEAYGEQRIFFGSDSPIYHRQLFPLTAHIPREERKELDAAAWRFSFEAYRAPLVEIGLDDEALERVFAGNARKIYGILKEVEED